jgi:hypothetical protein
MVAVVVVVIMVPVETTVTTLLAVILVVGTDATATDGITTASKGMVDILESRVVVDMMHTNRVAADVEGVWRGKPTPLLTEWEEVSGGEITNFQKAIGRVPIPRKCSLFFPQVAPVEPICFAGAPI